jgi:hypothetical protein
VDAEHRRIASGEVKVRSALLLHELKERINAGHSGELRELNECHVTCRQKLEVRNPKQNQTRVKREEPAEGRIAGMALFPNSKRWEFVSSFEFSA